MRKYAVSMSAAALLLAGAQTPGLAQQKKGQQPQAQPQAKPQCDLKASHFAVSRAILYIQSASSSQDTTKQKQSLEGAHRSLMEALEQGQGQNPAVWYYLGVDHTLKLDGDAAALSRADSATNRAGATKADSAKADSLRRAFLDDATAIDTSFARVESMMPDCRKDVEQFRYRAWAKATNQGIEALRGSNYPKAKEYFTAANKVYDKAPTAFFYLGTVYASEDNADSALRYFALAAKAAENDTAEKEVHEKSVQNMARIYQVLEKWDSAAVWFQAYRKLRPDDFDALADLGAVYFAAANAKKEAGDSAKDKDYVRQAIALHDSIMSKADGLDPAVLFRWGVSVFRAEHSREAAAAFETGLKRTPYYRNGLFNLTNAYFQLAQEKPDSARYYAAKMLPVAQRLAALDPMNRGVLRLIAAAYQFLGKDDSTGVVLKKVGDMKYEVEVQASRPTSTGFEVQGSIRALAPQALTAMRDTLVRDSTRRENAKSTLQTGKDPSTGRAIPTAQKQMLQQRLASLDKRVHDDSTALERLKAQPISVPTITFEFLDKDGKVVATERVAAQAVEPNGSKQFQLTPTGQGIVGWRYKVG
jgi:tetratricopeptide (TPR) repeat protein